MAKARERYWVPRLSQLIKRLIKHCHGCKRFHVSAFTNPPPGYLPTDRTEGTSPFQVVGIDYAGPIKYRNGRNKEGKAYIQPWPELLGHKGNKPVKMTYFLPPPPPDAMLMSGIQVIFGRLNIAWGKGGQKKWFTKTTLPTFFKRWIQSLI